MVDGRVVLVFEVAAALFRLTSSGLMASTFDVDLGGAQLPTVVAKAPARRWGISRHEPSRGPTAFRLFGTKMWISAGDHELGENIVHPVLAKIPGGPHGVAGISLFIVPKTLESGERNDVTLAGLDHKMGFRGTVNTVLRFGEGCHPPGQQPGAVGYLVGKQHTGLAAMFHMMNEARVGVGLGATALGYTGYLHSLEYARTRTQGRVAGTREQDGPPVAIGERERCDLTRGSATRPRGPNR